jgi:hypothetical protein
MGGTATRPELLRAESIRTISSPRGESDAEIRRAGATANIEARPARGHKRAVVTEGSPGKGVHGQTEQVALAFLVMAHRNPRQFGRLLRAIYRPGDKYVVHVDRNAPPEVYWGVRQEIGALPGVDMLPSMAVRWGGRSMVEVELRAIRRLLATSQDWSHFVNLSGQDFPLRPVAVMASELAQHPDRNYLQYFQPRDMPWTWENPAFPGDSVEFSRPESRVDRFYVEWSRRRAIRPLPFVRRNFPSGFVWYGGSQWKVLSRQACRYVTEQPDMRRLWGFFRHTFIPDESFFQTALLGSPLRGTVVNDNRRVVEWDPKIVTFTEEHRDFLLDSDAWFARKFDEQVDGRILDLLEQHLRSDPSR